MELCGEGCYPICDFCEHYNFNPGLNGRYENNGFCNLLKMKKDPHNGCEDFICGMEKELTNRVEGRDETSKRSSSRDRKP